MKSSLLYTEPVGESLHGEKVKFQSELLTNGDEDSTAAMTR